ncbi:MAG: response regulator transcription factor [Ferruginibacter sp.]|nr:response regulator transcription factor [Ferruginibacter sp.]
MTKQYKVLYVEDDETLAYLTKDSLEINNYQVHHFADGATALHNFESQEYDICILDIMVPKKDGFEIAQVIRQFNNEIPIIFLSAKTLKEDKIKGLKLGADDYLVKPFSIEELVLKIEIFLQRSKKNTSKNKIYHVGKYQFDTNNYEIIYENEKATLTLREAELLKLFIQNPQKVLKREDILKTLWGNDDYFMGRSLDVFISRLRKILCKDENIVIENLHGIGFKFSVKE